MLVIDDDPVIRSLLRKLLELAKTPYEIREAVDAASARRTLESDRFDCIVLDHLLPDMSGLDFLKWLRTKDHHTPVVVFTGMGDEALAVDMMKAGATDYLSKVGFVKERFLEAVRHASESRKATAHV
ncbi:MAG TPA: response regulator [Candidatus Thermoplasmatota archaeon]|nr:response regulator [Candidatus Thermoplasmatota archaeon]